jgi:hypothetical protein
MNTLERAPMLGAGLLRDPKMDFQAQAPDDYSGSLFLRCPKSLPTAIRQAARSHMTTSAAYVRGAILKQLQIDGLRPSAEET